ncbi:MAG: HxlR family transcriptional regulator [Solirubrobacterales bacterium]|nr:HxlR family transcriptional regulator [Solirubrobacterales bacterium]
MATSRSYGDACGIARALDVVGERWALLVVRELLLGPQRFSDLRRALDGASSNMLTDRLRELEGHGVLERRTLQPPAGSSVYALTEWGRALEPAVLALGAWGIRAPRPLAPATLSATSVLLFLRTCARLDPDAPSTIYRLELDDRVWTIRAAAGQLHVQPGEPTTHDVALRTDPTTLNALLANPASLDAAISDAGVVATGDLSALRRLLESVASQSPGQDTYTER